MIEDIVGLQTPHSFCATVLPGVNTVEVYFADARETITFTVEEILGALRKLRRDLDGESS